MGLSISRDDFTDIEKNITNNQYHEKTRNCLSSSMNCVKIGCFVTYDLCIEIIKYVFY